MSSQSNAAEWTVPAPSTNSICRRFRAPLSEYPLIFSPLYLVGTPQNGQNDANMLTVFPFIVL